MDTPEPSSQATPQETAERVAQTYFGAGSGPGARSRAVRRLILGAVVCAGLVPGLFYLAFGAVSGLGWSVMDVGRDLWEGPVLRSVLSTGRAAWVLVHTGQSLGGGTELNSSARRFVAILS